MLLLLLSLVLLLELRLLVELLRLLEVLIQLLRSLLMTLVTLLPLGMLLQLLLFLLVTLVMPWFVLLPFFLSCSYYSFLCRGQWLLLLLLLAILLLRRRRRRSIGVNPLRVDGAAGGRVYVALFAMGVLADVDDGFILFSTKKDQVEARWKNAVGSTWVGVYGLLVLSCLVITCLCDTYDRGIGEEYALEHILLNESRLVSQCLLVSWMLKWHLAVPDGLGDLTPLGIIGTYSTNETLAVRYGPGHASLRWLRVTLPS